MVNFLFLVTKEICYLNHIDQKKKKKTPTYNTLDAETEILPLFQNFFFLIESFSILPETGFKNHFNGCYEREINVLLKHLKSRLGS